MRNAPVGKSGRFLYLCSETRFSRFFSFFPRPVVKYGAVFRYPSYLGILRRFKELLALISIIYHLVREKPANRKFAENNFYCKKV